MNWQYNNEHHPSEINVVSERIERSPIEVTNVTYETAPMIVWKPRRKSLLKRFFGMLFRRRPSTVRVVDNDPIR